jgi:protein-tyrosine-phosphatase
VLIKSILAIEVFCSSSKKRSLMSEALKRAVEARSNFVFNQSSRGFGTVKRRKGKQHKMDSDSRETSEVKPLNNKNHKALQIQDADYIGLDTKNGTTRRYEYDEDLNLGK